MVSAIEFVKADGTLIRYSREETPELLEGARVHLGCLGVVSRLTLDVVPFYEVQSYRYDDAPLDTVIDNLPELWQSCDSLSVFSAGFGKGPGAGSCWVVFRHFSPHWEPSLAAPAHAPPEVLKGAALRETPCTRYCTDPEKPVMFTPTGKKPWHDGLTLTLDQGEETTMQTVDIQAEFFVPLHQAQDALRAVWEATREWTFGSPWGSPGEPVKGLVDAIEIRQVKGDGAWLSPHPVDSLGIHVSFNGLPSWWPEVHRALPALERALQPFSARAHWGKLAPATFEPERLEELYQKGLPRFRALCVAHDPTGKFRNAHVQHMLFPGRSQCAREQAVAKRARLGGR
jgi:xylitol oxidase